jgi:hypothetical protein
VLGGYLDFYTNNTVDQFSNSDGTFAMRLAASGNVGLGITNPTQKLHVMGQYPQALFGGLDSGGTNGLFVAGCSTPNTYNFLIGNQYNINGAFEITPSTVVGGKTFSTPAFVVKYNGNVGIGTTSPTEKLSVNGRIRAKEVIVDTGWSDYVFADDYKLPSLADVEAQIKTNKHLPGVPSAQEVAEKGVSVGDMQAVLLAKIEELTLHVIAQQKELGALRAKVINLERNAKESL